MKTVKKKKVGRPKGTGKKGQKVSVYLSDLEVEQIREIGDGNASAGIRYILKSFKPEKAASRA